MTIQEMFDKVYIGLASQGFEQCKYNKHKTFYSCAYSDDNGKHCAWGWVDLSLSASHAGNVQDLKNESIGIAATLNEEQLDFALKLQNAHDGGDQPCVMKNNLVYLALKYNLEIPK